MKKTLLILTTFLSLSAFQAQINSLPHNEGFEGPFTVGIDAEFIPNWIGNEVTTTNRIFQETVDFNVGAAALSVIPTGSFNGNIEVSLNLSSYQSVSFDFMAKSMQNGTGDRDAILTMEVSIDGGVNWIGNQNIGNFPNIDQASFASFTYNLPSVTNNQSDVKVRFFVSRSAGSGTTAKLIIDDVEITGTVAAPGTPVEISSDLTSGSEDNQTVITLTATSDANVTGDQTVTLEVGGVNINNEDYTISNTEITILNGTNTGSVTFSIVDDNLNEGTETAVISIIGTSAALSLGTNTSVSIEITDNDEAIELLSLNTVNPLINFDELQNDGTDLFDVTKGFYLFEEGANANSLYRANSGTTTTGDTYSFGSIGSNDRALGSITTGSLSPNSFGAKLINTTGSNLNAILISYEGEQWRGATADKDTLKFYYSTNATSIQNGDWTSVSELNFVSIHNLNATSSELDGNDLSNKTSISFQINGLSIQNNETIWIKWVDIDVPSQDHGLAIDNLEITPILVIDPIISANPSSLIDFEQTIGSPSVEKTFILNGSNLVNDIELAVTGDYEISLTSGMAFSNSIIVDQVGGAVSNISIYVRLNAPSIGLSNGNIALTSTNATDVNIILEGECIEEVIPTPEKDLIYYWHFNNLDAPNDANGAFDVTEINADFSLFPDFTPKMIYTGTGDRSIDENTTGTLINIQMGETEGKYARVRNPSSDRTLVFDFNTTGCSDLIFEYAIHRSGSGMLENVIDYSIDGGANFINTGLSPNTFTVTESFELVAVDFSSITAVNNNPDFIVRISFVGNTVQANGNNRYDNITLKGDASDIPSAINSINEMSFDVYPNPVNGENFIYLTKIITGNIYDVSGKICSSFVNQNNVNISKLSNGLYFIVSENGETKKFVINK